MRDLSSQAMLWQRLWWQTTRDSYGVGVNNVAGCIVERRMLVRLTKNRFDSSMNSRKVVIENAFGSLKINGQFYNTLLLGLIE